MDSLPHLTVLWANIHATSRFSRDRPRFADNLDVIKFLCKDLWTLIFRKQIDNLKTNHRVSQLRYQARVLFCCGWSELGRLRPHRWRIQTILTHEHAVVYWSGHEGTGCESMDRPHSTSTKRVSFCGFRAVLFEAVLLAWESVLLCKRKPQNCLVQCFRSKLQSLRLDGILATEEVIYGQLGSFLLVAVIISGISYGLLSLAFLALQIGLSIELQFHRSQLPSLHAVEYLKPIKNSMDQSCLTKRLEASMQRVLWQSKQSPSTKSATQVAR